MGIVRTATRGPHVSFTLVWLTLLLLPAARPESNTQRQLEDFALTLRDATNGQRLAQLPPAALAGATPLLQVKAW